ncbi:MAG: tRNA (adenosine(37)-N6)-threonylcarbamoyltransferase complex ATPase subunit type 1 TsaE, partial [Neisseriaceae bacterium]|nr:tRNA (adenosine(37)-N6)-threonylcarbamoyltransferase complex ATPase subunit type 1 TsaE [Neisseriaceae bacterium]
MTALFLANEHATLALAEQFSGCLKKFSLPENGLTLYLDGDLGAGKTTFVRGL